MSDVADASMPPDAPPADPVVPATRAGRLLGWASRHWRATLAALCLILWLPGIVSLPPIDRDESRFAQSSKQMLETLDFVDIRFGHVPRYKKPAGIYWLQSATTAVAGWGDRSHIWTYRLASLLGGILAVLLCFWCARAIAIPEVAWLSAALIATSLLLGAEATMATTDAVQLACLMGAMGVLLRVYLASHDPARPKPGLLLLLAGWAAFAFGILVKGPVVPAVCAVTILALIAWEHGRWRWLAALKPLTGIALVLLIVLPWGIAILLASHGEFYKESLGNDFAAKLANGQESHGAWPGYYLLLVTLTFWPAILFVLPALAAARRRWREPATRFLLAWAAASWLMIELVPTKLPNYILPAYPPIAMLAALWLLTPADPSAPRWQRNLVYVSAVQFAIGAVALAAAPALLPRYYGDGTTWWLIALAAAAGLLGLSALILYLRSSRLAAFGFAMLSVLAVYPALTAGAGPRLDRIWVSPRAAKMIARYTHAGDPPPILAGYMEPSLVFLLGTDTRLGDGRRAAQVGADQGGLALVDDDERPRFLAHLAELEADATPIDTLDGFNYTRGRKVHLTLYRLTAARYDLIPPGE
jgi:4-amino-4-deoxy-L-arabinose transferase-like glycosyltransferase